MSTAGDMRPSWRAAVRKELLPRHRALYAVLSTMAHFGDPDGGNVRPTVETLARRSGTSTRSVRRALAWARETGWIVQHSRGCRVKHRASFYTLQMGAVGCPPAPVNKPSIQATVTPIESRSVACIALTNTGHGGPPPISTTQTDDNRYALSSSVNDRGDLEPANGPWSNGPSTGPAAVRAALAASKVKAPPGPDEIEAERHRQLRALDDLIAQATA